MLASVQETGLITDQKGLVAHIRRLRSVGYRSLELLVRVWDFYFAAAVGNRSAADTDPVAEKPAVEFAATLGELAGEQLGSAEPF